MRYFLRLSYRGAPYHGWQVQPGEVTVQGAIQDALECIMRHPAPIVGAGRTDTGVNASMMIAHFDIEEPIADPQQFIYRLNSLLGKDIAIQALYPVHDEAHARFDATSRTYHYYAATFKSPFLYPLSWKAPASLDFDAMNRAARLLIETEDFTSFSKLHTDVKTNICHLTQARWMPVEAVPGLWCFEITADRFLRNMVRAVVGTLVEVGRGKLTISEFQQIIDARDRCKAGTSMPGEALYLHSITYPYPLK